MKKSVLFGSLIVILLSNQASADNLQQEFIKIVSIAKQAANEAKTPLSEIGEGTVAYDPIVDEAPDSVMGIVKQFAGNLAQEGGKAAYKYASFDQGHLLKIDTLLYANYCRIL